MDLFDQQPSIERLSAGTCLLRGFALEAMADLLSGIDSITQISPLVPMYTPSGLSMSVISSGCGALGWVSDRKGYRYEAIDPATQKPWPPMPEPFFKLAQQAAEAAGFQNFNPDACLINQYAIGARMSLHQDKDERDFSQPIVSVSIGIPAVFQFGGFKRTDKTTRLNLYHGDILVWGGADRLRFHGVLPIKHANYPILGERRINLTFRKAG